MPEKADDPPNYDELGAPLTGSTQVRDPRFQDRIVAETRAFLSAIPA